MDLQRSDKAASPENHTFLFLGPLPDTLSYPIPKFPRPAPANQAKILCTQQRNLLGVVPHSPQDLQPQSPGQEPCRCLLDAAAEAHRQVLPRGASPTPVNILRLAFKGVVSRVLLVLDPGCGWKCFGYRRKFVSGAYFFTVWDRQGSWCRAEDESEL